MPSYVQLLLPAALAISASVACAAEAPPEDAVASPALAREIEAYRVCATLNLPADFRPVKDSASAAALALEKCRKQRFVVAGQFALDHPGTYRTKAFVDELSTHLMQELSTWLEDVNSHRLPPQPVLRRSPR
ncbi:hypothetical protein GT347_03460 [Xylophilus rhododendri]|uniref:Lipoprotein n=1 Tax=Xylophilus rhododendri TaxID=2697032 RepID=A0A857J209_9BURK|nr:hypothetical protein [Xylophilus rhododendri]QHI97122.1 hypothetical protein GT347_03460 [Xylophilus rhododendri]